MIRGGMPEIEVPVVVVVVVVAKFGPTRNLHIHLRTRLTLFISRDIDHFGDEFFTKKKKVIETVPGRKHDDELTPRHSSSTVKVNKKKN